MASVADYVNRTVDVLAFAGAVPGRETPLTMALALPGRGGQVCTGAQKLAQRWLLEFFTERGTLRHLPDRGSAFMTLYRTGRLRTTLDAEQAFYQAAQQVESNLAQEEQATDPDDERLDRAELDSLALGGDSLTLHVTVWSRAGTSRPVILPIDVRIG